MPPPIVNVTAFNDLYLLTLPSFTWVKLFPDHHGNATYQYGHFSATCNMVKSNSQMIVIGGSYPPDTGIVCDLASQYWAQHNLWTGTLGNEGDNVNDTYWALYNPNLTSNAIPQDVYNIVGGNKDGSATQLAPTAGYDQGNSPGLDTLLKRKPTFTRTPTRSVSAPTNSTTPTQTSSPSSSKKLSTGAIVGIAIGCAAAAVIILVAWCIIGRRLYKKRREAYRQSQMTQQSTMPLGYRSPSVETPQSPQGQWLHSPGSPQPPTSLPPTELDAAQQRMYINPVEKPAE